MHRGALAVPVSAPRRERPLSWGIPRCPVPLRPEFHPIEALSAGHLPLPSRQPVPGTSLAKFQTGSCVLALSLSPAWAILMGRLTQLAREWTAAPRPAAGRVTTPKVNTHTRGIIMPRFTPATPLLATLALPLEGGEQNQF